MCREKNETAVVFLASLKKKEGHQKTRLLLLRSLFKACQRTQGRSSQDTASAKAIPANTFQEMHLIWSALPGRDKVWIDPGDMSSHLDICQIKSL